MLSDPISIPSSLCLLRGLPLPRKLGLLEKFYGKALTAPGITTVCCASGHVWILDLREVTHRWLVYGDYEGPHQMTGSGIGYQGAVSLLIVAQILASSL